MLTNLRPAYLRLTTAQRDSPAKIPSSTYTTDCKTDSEHTMYNMRLLVSAYMQVGNWKTFL
jgi:hypothetical protein